MSTTLQSHLQATVSSKSASMSFAAVVAPLQQGTIIPRAQKEHVPQRSASRQRQPSDAHQQANGRSGKRLFLPCSHMWWCVPFTWNFATQRSDDAACPLAVAAITMMESAQAALLQALPSSVLLNRERTRFGARLSKPAAAPSV